MSIYHFASFERKLNQVIEEAQKLLEDIKRYKREQDILMSRGVIGKLEQLIEVEKLTRLDEVTGLPQTKELESIYGLFCNIESEIRILAKKWKNDIRYEYRCLRMEPHKVQFESSI